MNDQVVVMTVSEFGGRVTENASQGTDRDAVAPMFLTGTAFVEAVYGTRPSLMDLDDGDRKYRVDFRCVYRTLIEHWLGVDTVRVQLEGYPELKNLFL